MERSNKFFSLGKTLAAGTLALAMLPGAALATASYSADAFVDVTFTVDPGLLFVVDIDLDETASSTTGNAVVTDETSFVSIAGSPTEQEASVAGSASPATGGSSSSALAANGLLFTVENPTDAPLDVLFEFVYGAGVTASMTDPSEAVGAIASILIGTIFSGDVLDTGFDVTGNAQDSLGDTLSYTLTVDPFFFDGLFVDVSAEGIAVSGVPVPATLALLGIGLMGFASRKRFVAARA